MYVVSVKDCYRSKKNQNDRPPNIFSFKLHDLCCNTLTTAAMQYFKCVHLHIITERVGSALFVDACMVNNSLISSSNNIYS
jgi:hypothetical protein